MTHTGPFLRPSLFFYSWFKCWVGLGVVLLSDVFNLVLFSHFVVWDYFFFLHWRYRRCNNVSVQFKSYCCFSVTYFSLSLYTRKISFFHSIVLTGTLSGLPFISVSEILSIEFLRVSRFFYYTSFSYFTTYLFYFLVIFLFVVTLFFL